MLAKAPRRAQTVAVVLAFIKGAREARERKTARTIQNLSHLSVIQSSTLLSFLRAREEGCTSKSREKQRSASLVLPAGSLAYRVKEGVACVG